MFGSDSWYITNKRHFLLTQKNAGFFARQWRCFAVELTAPGRRAREERGLFEVKTRGVHRPQRPVARGVSDHRHLFIYSPAVVFLHGAMQARRRPRRRPNRQKKICNSLLNSTASCQPARGPANTETRRPKAMPSREGRGPSPPHRFNSKLPKRRERYRIAVSRATFL